MEASKNVQEALRGYDLTLTFDLIYACDLTTEQGRVDFFTLVRESRASADQVWGVLSAPQKAPTC